MNYKELRAIQYGRGHMHVDSELFERLIDQTQTKKNDHVVVMFSYELLPLLKDMKFKNITLFYPNAKKSVKNIVQHYGCKLVQEINSKMKINVILGNPPYQDSSSAARNRKLWRQFSEMAIATDAKTIAFVTPNAAFKDIDSNGKAIRKALKEHKYGVVEFRDHKNTAFPSVGVETCHWVVSKDSTNGVDDFVFSTLDPLTKSIVDKVLTKAQPLPVKLFDKIPKDQLSITPLKNPIYNSGDKLLYTDKDVPDQGKLKLVLPFSSSYHKMFVTDKACGMLNSYVLIKSEQEGEQIKQYALSKLLKLVAAKFNRTSGFTPFARRGIVDLRFKQNWTDVELYEYFGLTEEEIEYVEQNS